jgi:hypothetical protein
MNCGAVLMMVGVGFSTNPIEYNENYTYGSNWLAKYGFEKEIHCIDDSKVTVEIYHESDPMTNLDKGHEAIMLQYKFRIR